MLVSMANIHLTIDYIEINGGDLAAATAFYGVTFGWEFNDYGRGNELGVWAKA